MSFEEKRPVHLETQSTSSSDDQNLNYYDIDFQDGDVYETKEYNAALKKADLRMLIIYSIAYLFTQINKSNVGNAAIMNVEEGDGIRKALGNLTSQQWAWVLSIFFYPYLFFEPVTTMLLKKFSPRVWQSRLMLTWGTISMLQAVAKDYQGILAIRFFLGLAEAGFYTGIIYHFSFWYRPRQLPTRIAIFYGSGQLSSAFSGIVAYGISFMNGKQDLYGWQWLFIFEGIPTVACGIYSAFYLPNYPEDSKFLSEREKLLIISRLPKSAPKRKDGFFVLSEIKELLKDSTFYSYTGIWLFFGIGSWGLSTVIPTVLFELGFSSTAETQLMTMPGSIIGFFLLNLFGWLIQKRLMNGYQVGFGMAVTLTVGYIILAAIDNPYAKYVFLVICTAVTNSIFAILWADRVRVARGTSSTGLAVGWTNAICQLMGIVSPQFYQPKFGPTYRTSFIISAALCFCGTVSVAATWLLVYRRGILHTEGAYLEDEDIVKRDEFGLTQARIDEVIRAREDPPLLTQVLIQLGLKSTGRAGHST
ncbi:hypothetical protein LJB42_000919 [Komagataella kurtzmanii]|nr:hypothetical protein LJB42_000919 [Komagataella kurtzmanii]